MENEKEMMTRERERERDCVCRRRGKTKIVTRFSIIGMSRSKGHKNNQVKACSRVRWRFCVLLRVYDDDGAVLSAANGQS